LFASTLLCHALLTKNVPVQHEVGFVSKEEIEALRVSEEVEHVPTQALQPDGEINWDCPCLKGMAHGTCGEDFKSAFSCFVFSKEEVRGSDCFEQFSKMQNCILSHPEEYGPPPEPEAAAPADSATTEQSTSAPAS
jgi:mitochondrial intermembrane space import and assembly protein 40